MKTIKFLGLLVFSIVFFSCSSGDDDSSSNSPNTFTYTYAGSNVPITQIIARKSEDRIVISGVAANGQGIDVEFNRFGNLGTI